MTALLVLKMTLAPTLTIAATLSARRWGSAVGGWIAGFPLTSGPISLLLSLQYGLRFGQEAAHGTILGLIGACAFVAAYAVLAQRSAWPLALTAGLLSFTATLGVLHLIAPGFWVSVALLGVILFACISTIPLDDCRPIERPDAWWDLPFRASVVTALILGITAVAPLLGERLSGLVSPMPVVTGVLLVFAHQTRRLRAVTRLVRGVVSSLFGFAAFFIVVHQLPAGFGLLAIYLLALVACLTVNVLTYDRLLRSAASSSVEA